MQFDFDTIVNRAGIGNLKDHLVPQPVQDAGYMSFVGAEFEFRTAPCLIDAVVKAAENGLFGFTIANRRYLEAVQWWLETVRGYIVDKDWIIPTHGTIFSVATTIRLLTERGDGVIIPIPGYNRYEQAVKRLSRVPVFTELRLDDKGCYQLDFDDIEHKMSQKNNKLFILCNPNNPTGNIWGEEDLSALARLSEKYEVAVFSDEIFAEICFESRAVIPYTKIAGQGGLAITCTSLGKAFGLTGVNHANVIIENEKLRSEFYEQRNADHYGSIDPMLHAALLGAYTPEGADWLKQMKDYVWENILFVEEFCREYIPVIKPYHPQGTYVMWMDFRELGLKHECLEKFLIEKAMFSADSGRDYYSEGFMRLNMTLPRKKVEVSFKRLLEALQK
jgi:cystathionine beta-lyase